MVLGDSIHQDLVLSRTPFLLYIYDLPDEDIYNLAIFADISILSFKCDWASDLWQQLDSASSQSLVRDTGMS